MCCCSKDNCQPSELSTNMDPEDKGCDFAPSCETAAEYCVQSGLPSVRKALTYWSKHSRVIQDDQGLKGFSR